MKGGRWHWKRRRVDQTELSKQEKEEEKEEKEEEEEEEEKEEEEKDKGWTAADSDLAHYCHMHTFPIFCYCQLLLTIVHYCLLLSHAGLSTQYQYLPVPIP